MSGTAPAGGAVPFDRGRAEADFREYAGRHRLWTRLCEGEYVYVPWGPWRASVTIGDAGFAWEFKSHDGWLDLGTGESADAPAMIRAVRAGPEPVVRAPGDDAQAGGAG